MFRIGEFSKLMQVSVRMLRFYDEAGLLRPAEVDRWTGYRLYSPDQIPALNRILFLRDLGFGTAEMAPLLANWEDPLVEEALRQKQKQVDEEIRTAQKRHDRIAGALRDFKEERLFYHCNVTLRAVPEYRVLSLRRQLPDYFAECTLWQELGEFTEHTKAKTTGEAFGIYHDQEFKLTEVDVEVCAVVSTMGESREGFTYRTVPAVETMACTMVYGPFESLAGAYRSFADWLSVHPDYEISGEDRQIVHRGPWNEPEPDNYLTEIQIPLVPRN